MANIPRMVILVPDLHELDADCGRRPPKALSEGTTVCPRPSAVKSGRMRVYEGVGLLIWKTHGSIMFYIRCSKRFLTSHSRTCI